MSSPNQTTAYNPSLPYVTSINGGLYVGKRIVIEGRVNDRADAFQVNLKRGPGEKDQKALHFNPRLNNSPPVIVRNSYLNDWGSEERGQPGEFPFYKGRSYKVEFICEQNQFIINIDGKFFCSYNYRVPLTSITHLELLGDTTVSLILITDANDWNPASSKFGGNANSSNNYGGNQNFSNNYGGNPNSSNNYGGNQNFSNNYGGNQNSSNNYGGNANSSNNYGGNPNSSNNYGGNPNSSNNYGGNPNSSSNYGGNQNASNYGQNPNSSNPAGNPNSSNDDGVLKKCPKFCCF